MDRSERLIGVISLLGKKTRRFCDQSIGAMGLTGVQGRVLCYIFIVSQWQDVFQKDIEEEFDIRRSSATGVLQLLERNGMIRRVSVPHDARLKKIVVTEKALSIQEKVLAESIRIEERFRGDLTLEEVRIFRNLCERICKNIN